MSKKFDATSVKLEELERELTRQDEELDEAIAAIVASPRGRRAVSAEQVEELEALRLRSRRASNRAEPPLASGFWMGLRG